MTDECETTHYKQGFMAHRVPETGAMEPLAEHLRAVAERAAAYCAEFGAGMEGRLAGLLHDLGKYGERFQRRLRGKETGIDHWTPGAWAALTYLQRNGIALALAIQGHHIGLQRADKDSLCGMAPAKLEEDHPLKLKLSHCNVESLIERLRNDGLSFEAEGFSSIFDYNSYASGQQHAALMLDVRMLYSALVDADFIETEAFFESATGEEKKYRPSGPPLLAAETLDCLRSYVETLADDKQVSGSTELVQLRQDLFRTCLDAGQQDRGIFTLTAPTGSGKTLSMLAFALAHALKHGLKRIIYVLPYLTIIEQTVVKFRQVLGERFGEGYLLEDHSLIGTGLEKHDSETREWQGAARRADDDQIVYRRNFLSENWDAPIIVTTAVQMLESLFANRPSACRKLHRLAKSVILFDEVQTLPTRLVIPTLATLSWLSQRYGSSIVFATATQPAFGHLDQHVKKLCLSGWQPQEIVRDKCNLYGRIKRVEVDWSLFERPISWAELARLIADEHQALCVVNIKRHAWKLFDEVKRLCGDDTYHLSTNMCPMHRKTTLETVRERLLRGKTCRLISTQCVEAGVDLDFPVVFRALGPLDAIAQAAGRCNRHAMRSIGRVVIFMPADDETYPDFAYEQAAKITSVILKDRGTAGLDIEAPANYEKYYTQLYEIGRPERRSEELHKAIQELHFVDVARLYRVIEKGTVNLLVPYDVQQWMKLRKEVEETGLNRLWVAKARPYSISIYLPRNTAFFDPVYVGPQEKGRPTDWYIYLRKEDYDPEKGLLPRDEQCLIA